MRHAPGEYSIQPATEPSSFYLYLVFLLVRQTGFTKKLQRILQSSLTGIGKWSTQVSSIVIGWSSEPANSASFDHQPRVVWPCELIEQLDSPSLTPGHEAGAHHSRHQKQCRHERGSESMSKETNCRVNGGAMRKRYAIPGILFLLIVTASHFPAKAADVISGKIIEVKSADLVVLDYGHGTYNVRIAGIDVPKQGPIAVQAKQLVTTLVLGMTVRGR